MSLPKVIYVMGPPGAGKGTQVALLAEKTGYQQFSTGNAFRTVSRQDTPIGKKVKALIDNGHLAPPELAAEIVIAAVEEQVSHGKGVIFDGTPRTLTEATLVDAFFANRGYGRPLVLHLVIDKDEMIKRNSKRQFCLDIPDGFPITSKEDAQRCEANGGRVGRRPDDEPEKADVRWNEFSTRTLPALEKYKAEGFYYYEVDALPAVEIVHERVMAVINLLREQAA